MHRWSSRGAEICSGYVYLVGDVGSLSNLASTVSRNRDPGVEASGLSSTVIWNEDDLICCLTCAGGWGDEKLILWDFVLLSRGLDRARDVTSCRLCESVSDGKMPERGYDFGVALKQRVSRVCRRFYRDLCCGYDVRSGARVRTPWLAYRETSGLGPEPGRLYSVFLSTCWIHCCGYGLVIDACGSKTSVVEENDGGVCRWGFYPTRASTTLGGLTISASFRTQSRLCDHHCLVGRPWLHVRLSWL